MTDRGDWPPQSTGSGLLLRLVSALGQPGRPRRAAVMFLSLIVFMLAVVVIVVATS